MVVGTKALLKGGASGVVAVWWWWWEGVAVVSVVLGDRDVAEGRWSKKCCDKVLTGKRHCKRVVVGTQAWQQGCGNGGGEGEMCCCGVIRGGGEDRGVVRG